MKKMLMEFKTFAMRGNVLDMAVGIIIGGAFGKIVTSLVNDVMMPILGRVTGNVDFGNLYVNLSGNPYASFTAAKDAGAPVLAYGLFVNTVINFVIVAFAIFLLVQAMNKLHKKQDATAAPAAPPPPSAEQKLLGEIRDLLKAK